MNKEVGFRARIENDINAKIANGDTAHLHLPARDMYVFYQMAKGVSVRNLAPDLGMAPRSIIRSMDYLRDATGAASTEQAFAVLVARGFPLPEDLLPNYNVSEIHFRRGHLDAIKGWAQGKTYAEMEIESGVSESVITNQLFYARRKVGAFTNIQLMAVAVKEGFLRPKQEDDGSYSFEVNQNPVIKNYQKQILLMRYAGMTDEEISTRIEGLTVRNARREMYLARLGAGVRSDLQLLLHCVQTGQIPLETVTEEFDLEKAKKLPRSYKRLLQSAVTNGWNLKQLANELCYSYKSLATYSIHINRALGVKIHMQAVMLYAAALQEGIVPFEEKEAPARPTKELAPSGVIYTRDSH